MRVKPRSFGALFAHLLISFDLLIGGTVSAAEPPLAPSSLLQAGERIYREGVDPSGTPLRAEWFVGVPLRPEQAACITCHRASGMGSIEGQTVVPSVVGQMLYQPGKATAVRFGPSYERRVARPAYTDVTLARAIREGIDPAGQPIAAPMPRFDLDEAAMAQLIAYLKSLSTATAPGVTDQEIHLATVMSEGVSSEKRRAMLTVLEAFVGEKNGGSRSQSRQTEPGVWTITDRRQWRLHVWELSGPQSTWPQQLATHYRHQPVFALLGGLAAGPWQPIHDFCETSRLPCLFPSTDLPVLSATGTYSMYFSRGMSLEASALAQYLQEAKAAGRVLQVVSDDPRSLAAAAAFRKALRRHGMPAPKERRLAGAADARLWTALLRGKQGMNLVLWLPRPDLAALEGWAGNLERVVVSSSLVEGRLQVSEVLNGKVMAIHPFVQPGRSEQQLARLRSWLRSKGIASGDERIQAEAYFAASTVSLGLTQIADTYSREYFLERIEDMNENTATESIYPRVTLGPGQRFASKGAYLLAVPPGDAMPTVAGWFLP